MKSIKETTQAFVVRIWIEPGQMHNQRPVWRGVIERVESGERVYFDQLEKLCGYFARYIEETVINIDDHRK